MGGSGWNCPVNQSSDRYRNWVNHPNYYHPLLSHYIPLSSIIIIQFTIMIKKSVNGICMIIHPNLLSHYHRNEYPINLSSPMWNLQQNATKISSHFSWQDLLEIELLEDLSRNSEPRVAKREHWLGTRERLGTFWRDLFGDFIWFYMIFIGFYMILYDSHRILYDFIWFS